MPKNLLLFSLFFSSLSVQLSLSQILSDSHFPAMPYKNTSASVISDRFGPYVFAMSSESYSSPFLGTDGSMARGLFILSPELPPLKPVLHPGLESSWSWGLGGYNNRIRSSFVRIAKDSLFLLWSDVDEEWTDVGPFLYLKPPVVRFARLESDSFRTFLTVPNGFRPSLAAGLSGDLHAVWEYVQPIEPNPAGKFYRFSSSIVYRRRDPSGTLSDSVLIGKGFQPTIRTKNGSEYILSVQADSSGQPSASIVLHKGTNGVFDPGVTLYPYSNLSAGRYYDRYEQFAPLWDVDSAGAVHIIQRVYNYPFNKIQITHCSATAGVQIDSLNDLTAHHRFRPDGSVSFYRIVAGSPSWMVEHYRSVSGTPIQKIHSFSIPSNVLLSQIIADKNGMEHLLLQEATTEQNIFLVRNAASVSATVTLIGKGYIAGNSAHADDKNTVLLAGVKGGVPVLLRFSLDSVNVFQDFRFPLAVGNEWYYDVTEFSDPGSPPPPTREIAKADSAIYMPNGKQYIRITSKRWMPSYYRKEGLRVYQYSPADSQEYLRMDFSKRQGDTVGVYGPLSFHRTVVELRTMQTQAGVNAWTYYFRGTVPKLDSINAIIVMDSLGIIGRSMPVGPTWNLIGAKISGKEYGTILDVKGSKPLLPSGLWLSQNYPNPFNPNTVISFQLSAVSQTTLVIYDVVGREIATLVNEMKAPGTYSVTWDASRFASGIYFAKLMSGGRSTVKKMILMK